MQIFSTNADLVTVDTNIRRIFIKEFHLSEKISDKGAVGGMPSSVSPKGRSREWHNALMDYGALHLTAKKTGIKPKTQQSRFEGSDRQIRARILRYLLNDTISLSELEKTFGIEQLRLRRILDKMVTEKIIVNKNNSYQLNE